MTVMAEHTSQMSVDEFETIASAAPETVTLEFIDGRIGVKKVTDGDHDTIVSWLTKRCIQARPDLDVYTVAASASPRTDRAGRSPTPCWRPRRTSRRTASGPIRRGR